MVHNVRSPSVVILYITTHRIPLVQSKYLTGTNCFINIYILILSIFVPDSSADRKAFEYNVYMIVCCALYKLGIFFFSTLEILQRSIKAQFHRSSHHRFVIARKLAG